MPTETVIIVTLIVGVFVMFAATLAIADYRTGRARRHQPAE